ncbi:MAG: GreA/GreB family elongation factor [Pseudomonadota bacterium]
MNSSPMTERTLTQLDYVRLTRLASQFKSGAPEAVLTVLDTSDLVASEAVPGDVVTMYTQLLLQGDEGTPPYRVTLCYPGDAEPAAGFISVLSPLGSSLIGLRAGEVAHWQTPSGSQPHAKIVEVLFQPEASGDYTL